MKKKNSEIFTLDVDAYGFRLNKINKVKFTKLLLYELKNDEGRLGEDKHSPEEEGKIIFNEYK